MRLTVVNFSCDERRCVCLFLAHTPIRGVGVWHLDTLEYGEEGSAAAHEADEMWDALSVFTQPEDEESRKVRPS